MRKQVTMRSRKRPTCWRSQKTEKPTANKANWLAILYFLIYTHSRPNLNELCLKKENLHVTCWTLRHRRGVCYWAETHWEVITYYGAPVCVHPNCLLYCHISHRKQPRPRAVFLLCPPTETRVISPTLRTCSRNRDHTRKTDVPDPTVTGNSNRIFYSFIRKVIFLFFEMPSKQT